MTIPRNIKANFKYILIIGVLVIVVVAGVLIYRGLKVSKGWPLGKTGCDWRPARDYGLCERILGAYYNGERCVWLTGCSTEGDKIPFKLMQDCEISCQK